MGELSEPYPGMQCVLPHNTVVYDSRFELGRLGLPRMTDEVHRVGHHIVALVIATAAMLELASYSLCLVPVPAGALLEWVYNRNIRTHA